MKKTFHTLLTICCLALFLTLSLTACGGNSAGHNDTLLDDTLPDDTLLDDTLPDDTLPDDVPSPIISYRKTIGVGQLYEEIVSGVGITAVLSDETVVKLESLNLHQSGEHSICTVRGLKEGTAVITFLESDGVTVIEQHEYTVKEEETVRVGEGKLVSDITVDKTTAEIYRDDTLVTYTFTTSSDVDRLEFVQVTHIDQKFLFDEMIEAEAREDKNLVIFELDKLIIDETSLTEALVENEALGTLYSATKTVSGDTATWTVKWDLGATAVRFIRIKAIDTETNTKQTNYVKLNFTYPVVSNDEEGFAKVVELFIKSNSTAPLLFKLNDGAIEFSNDYHTIFIGKGTNFLNRFNNTAIYGGNSIEYLTPYASVMPYSVHDFISKEYGYTEKFGDKNVLCDFSYYYGHTLGFYYPITDELRAVIAYQNGYEIDEELFPYAHSILERASAVLDEIITDGMTDFEKEKAIYTWMYEQGLKELTPTPEGVEEYKVFKTAYGLLNNYGGDCMGWSGTFYTLCNMAGLDCVTVDVRAEAGGAADEFYADHRINMIRLDGEYYFVEAFWSYQKEDPSDGTYRYMNMTTEKAATEYTWLTEENGGPFVCDYENYLVDEQTGELLNK